MKKLLFTLFLGITGVFVYAQTTETILYTWMSGPNTLNAPSAFGVKGVPSTTNIPASIYGPVSWSDNSGNFWLFGGSQSSTNKFNALFRYNPSTNEWTWMSGGNSYNNIGVYGTKGVAAAANTPGARVGSVTWKGADGNLYLFGGYGYAANTSLGDLNDVWKFDITTGQWTWIAGSNTINPAMVYGTMGVTTSSNTPNGRTGGIGWVDNNGVFWTYGGFNNANTRYHSDLWKFEITTAQWTYMGGSQSFNNYGTFGTKGVAAPTNFPGCRVSGVGVTDSNNNLWLFGGTGTDGAWGEFNDLWKYDIALGQWTWMSGGNLTSQSGTYGTKGVPNAANKPGSRRSHLAWYKGNSIYVQGGWGRYSTTLAGHLNDVWKYDISLGQWTWISGIDGRNALTAYGTKGVTAISNSIGGRSEAASFVDNSGSFWIFGGRDFSTGILNNTNDLWKLDFCNAPTAVNVTAATNTIICAAQTTTLSATGIGTIGWYTAATGGTFVAGGNNFTTPTLTSTTTYYIQDSTCGPGTRVAVTVSVMPIPNLAVANLSVCANGSVNLVASGANTYTWSTGSNSATLTTFPSANETYTLSGTNTTNGCTNSIVRTLTVVPLPTLTVSPNSTICSGKSVTLGAAGANTYQWNFGPTTASVGVAPGVTTNYTVTGYGTGNCSSKEIITITVNASPVLTLTPASTTLCAGSVMTLSVSGAPSYTWNTGANTNTLQIAPTSNTSYTVIGEAVNGCTTAAVKNISTLVSPTVSITGPTVTCAGSPVTLVGSGATTYTWSTGVFTNSITPSPTTTTIYTLTGKNANVCTKTSTIEVTVNQLPVLSITPSNTTICLGSTYTLAATGADTYTWNASINSNSIVVSPTVNTSYSLTGVDLTTGCSKTAVKTLSVLALPNVVIGGTNVTVCVGGFINLVANGVVTYTWSTGETTLNIQPTPTVSTTYTLIGTGTNGCVNSAVKTVTVNPLPTLTVTGNNVLCSGQATTLTVSGANTYTWSAGFIAPMISVSPTSSTNYTVIGKDANNCSNTTTYFVTVNPSPTLTISPTNTLLCAGGTATININGATSYTWSTGENTNDIIVAPNSTTTYSVIGTAGSCSGAAMVTISVSNSIVVTANASSSAICSGDNISLFGSGASTYVWTGGVTDGVSFSPSSTDTYTVIGTAGTCSNSAVVTVTVNSLPILNVITTNSVLCSGQTATLSVTGASTYTWSDNSNTAVIAVSPTSNTTYTVIGTDANNCSNSSVFTQSVSTCTGIDENTIEFSFRVFPNPNNGDFSIQSQREDVVTIFNELGQVIETIELNQQNNFSCKVNSLPNGIYFVIGKTIKQKVIITK